MTQNLYELTLMERVELYDKAMKLHEEEGLGSKRISKLLNVPTPTVGNWLYKDAHPASQYEFEVEDGAGPDLPQKPTDEYLRWFAGFWEGEGSLKTRGEARGNRLDTTLSVTQTKDRGERVLSEMVDKFNVGSVGKQTYATGKATCYTYRVNRKKYVIQIVEWMIPFARFRKKELKEAHNQILEHMESTSAWTPEDERFLADNWKNEDAWIAKQLNRTEQSIAKKRKRLGFKKHRDAG